MLGIKRIGDAPQADCWLQSNLNVSVVRQVLQDFQENPQAAQHHTKNPMIMEKLQKLINAGIVRQA